MITINNHTLESIFHKKIKVGIEVLGIDTASRTGWCRAKVGKKKTTFDYGFVDMKGLGREYKYQRYIDIFKSMEVPDLVIIEEAFMGRNPKGFQLLSRLGGFAFAVMYLRGATHQEFLLATSARKFLGFKGNLKKAVVHEEFKERTGIEITDEDIIDAIILCLNGILEENLII